MEVLNPFHASIHPPHHPDLQTPPSPTHSAYIHASSNLSDNSLVASAITHHLLRTYSPSGMSPEMPSNAEASSSKLPTPTAPLPSKIKPLPPIPGFRSERKRASPPAPLLIPASGSLPLFSSYANGSEFEEGVDFPRSDTPTLKITLPSNPLAHTWGQLPPPPRVTAPPVLLTKPRRRRATISNLSDEELNPGSRSRSSSSEDRHNGVPRPPSTWETARSTLPPGALPAVDPASKSVYEVFAQDQYGQLGETVDERSRQRSPPPPRAYRVPARSSSMDLKNRRDSPPRPRSDEDSPLNTPFSYTSPRDVQYDLLSVAMNSTTRPLLSPALSARRSSLANQDFFSSRAVINGPDVNLLGLQSIDQVGMSAGDPSELDPRVAGSMFSRSSGKGVLPRDDEELDSRLSIASAVDLSEGTGSGHDFSISSASTSLSRSQKSGKPASENVEVESKTVDPLTHVLEQALAIRTARWLKQADRRKYMLTELVETEVAYNEHLQDLVMIYLPQLAAVPIVSTQQRTVIARNLIEISSLHEQMSTRMVEALVAESLGWETSVDDVARTDRLIRKLAAIFVDNKSAFSVYDTYCSGSAASNAAIRELQYHPDWVAFEKRCRLITAAKPVTTLLDLLKQSKPDFRPDLIPPMTLSSRPSRLMLRDLLIKPIQRICQYHLLLGNLVNSVNTPSASVERLSFHVHPQWEVGVDMELAFATMREAAQHANEANRRSLVGMRTLNIASRMEEHPYISRQFVKSLGDNILAGPLDVLYHSLASPLTPAVKVKYLSVFLYAGYAIIAKAKKENHYQVKHFFPLEMFELIDVTEGFLPNSIRLVARDHTFEMAAICSEEKDIWAAALVEAKALSPRPPFDLPSSITGVRSRRASTLALSASAESPAAIRAFLASEALDFGGPLSPSLPSSPTMASMPTTPMRSSAQLLMRRPSPLLRATVDRFLSDVISEELVAARNLVGSQHLFFAQAASHTPLRSRLSIRDSTVLRRRRSEVDVKADGGAEGSSRGYSRDSTGKRSSVALSIKRGLSLSSHEGFNALAAASQETGPQGGSSSILSSLRRSATYSRSPKEAQSEFAAPPATDFGPAPVASATIPEVATPEPERDPVHQEKHRSSFQGLLRRKSSIGDFFSGINTKAVTQPYSVPTSPVAASRKPLPIVPVPSYNSQTLRPTMGDNPAECDVYQLGAGLTNTKRAQSQTFLQRSLTIGPRVRSKSYDADSLAGPSSRLSPRVSPATSTSDLSSGNNSAAASPKTGDSGVLPSSADFAPSQGPPPRRRRSVFLGFTGFTRINKSSTPP